MIGAAQLGRLYRRFSSTLSSFGIILCRDKNNAVVEMTLPEDNAQIFASKYETVLPKKEDLKRLLEEQLSAEDEGTDR